MCFFCAFFCAFFVLFVFVFVLVFVCFVCFVCFTLYFSILFIANASTDRRPNGTRRISCEMVSLYDLLLLNHAFINVFINVTVCAYFNTVFFFFLSDAAPKKLPRRDGPTVRE